MGRKKKFSSVMAGEDLLDAMAEAIRNITEEIKKPVGEEMNGSARRAELKSIKESALDAKELITEYQKLETMIKELKESGGIKEESEYSGGMAERFARRSN